MAYLLDTCAILWANFETVRLSSPVKKALEQNESETIVSSVSSAEIGCLQIRNRVRLPTHWKPWFREVLGIHGWECLPVDLEILEEAYSLPGSFHPDPVDRILVATARLKGLTLITADQKILDYPHVKTLW